MQASSYPSVFHRLNLEGNLLLPNAWGRRQAHGSSNRPAFRQSARRAPQLPTVVAFVTPRRLRAMR
jgi:hypothetical protein